MQCECVRDRFIEAVAKVERVAGKNPTLPILSCLLLEVKKGELIIKATNLDLAVVVSIPSKTTSTGIVAVSANTLSSFLGTARLDKGVSVLLDGDVLVIRSGNDKVILKTMPHTDFPSIPEASENEQNFSVESKVWAVGARSVFWSASVSGLKPELSSVFVYSDSGNLVFAATDSFRLAEKKFSTKEVPESFRVLIPSKNAAEISRIAEGTEGEIKVSFGKGRAGFFLGDTFVTTRLVEGTFPDYRQILPKETETEAVLLKEDFARALRVSGIFTDKFSQIGFTVDPKKKLFKVTAKNSDVGENTTLLPSTLTGESLEINFNQRYIADCLSSISSDSVSLSFAGSSKPLVLKGVSDKSFTYLVMPMNR